MTNETRMDWSSINENETRTDWASINEKLNMNGLD